MLPAVLDQTILATARPVVARDLGAISDVAWVVTAYVVAAAAATPLWGKLGDRHGRKPLLEGALALFLAASAACGLARGIAFLIVARAVQGVAAGGLMSLAMAAVGDLVAPRAGPDRPARPAAHAHRRRRLGGAVPDHRRAVRGQRVRAAVPADDDRRVTDAGRSAARADDGRDHGVDEPRRPRAARRRALQA